MLFLFGGGEKKKNKTTPVEAKRDQRIQNARETFQTGKFPVVTTPMIDGRKVRLVRGLVSCRGFDSESAFYGMVAKSMDICADAIIGYQENVAFHPDGAKHFSCYGTAVILEKDSRETVSRIA